MKLALVSVDEKEALPPLGLGYLASFLKEKSGFENTIIVDKEDQLKRIRMEKPDLIGISCTTMDFIKAKKLAEQIKEEFDIPLLIGGFHVTALPNTMPKAFDVGVMGEGEQVLVELVDAFEKKGSFEAKDLSKIKSVVYRSGNKLKINPRRANIEPLDSIPYPDRSLFKMKEYYLKPSRHTYDKLSIGTSLITTRGCMYQCAFCSQTGFWQHTMRFFSPEYVVGEMDSILDNYKIEMLPIMDDLFAVDKKRVKRISELMKEHGITDKVELHVFGRSNLIDEEMCKYLQKMNVKYINFGFESGSDKVLHFLKKNTVDVANHERALELCAKYGMNVDAGFIFGAPGETKEDMEKTFKLMRNPNLKSSMIFKLSPLPGSEVWDMAMKRGLVNENMNFDELHANIGNTKLPHLNDAMSPQEFREMVPEIWKAYHDCNYRHGPLKIKWRYLLNINLIKRFLQDWRGFSREMILRIKKKYFRK